VFGGNTLKLSDNMPASRTKGARNVDPGLFKPRNFGPSKPKAGLGFKKTPVIDRGDGSSSSAPVASISGGKGQDDFRRMLEKK